MDLFTDEPKWTGGCAPFIHSILYHEPGMVRFHGDCDMEPETMPVERVLTTTDGVFHIEVMQMIVIASEEDGKDIELHYRVIEDLNPSQAAAARIRCLTLLPAENRRDRWHRQQRLWEEWQLNASLNRNLTFTPAPVDPPPPMIPSSPLQKIESYHHYYQCNHSGDGRSLHET